MTSSYKKIILFFIYLTIQVSLTAQDFHYSQFYNSPLTTNPGNTGVFNGDLRAYSMYRMQWFTVTTPYKTLSLGVDAPIFKKRMNSNDFFSAGININNDGEGAVKYTTNSFNGLLSFTKYLGGRQDHDITIGYEIGYSIATAGVSRLTWDSQYDPVAGNYNPAQGINESYGGGGTGYLDMSTGLVWNFTTSNLFRSALGFSYHHITAPNVSLNGGLDRLYPRLGVQWNMAYKLGEKSNATLLPSFMVAQQGTTLLFNGGTNIRYVLQEGSHYTRYQDDKAVYFGAFYRFRDAAYVTFRFDYNNISVGVAYDINISKLTPASKSVGSFEFMLQYKGAFGKHRYAKKNSIRFM
jgi:type IX secretion system PorP/SprF family membrane protein